MIPCNKLGSGPDIRGKFLPQQSVSELTVRPALSDHEATRPQLVQLETQRLFYALGSPPHASGHHLRRAGLALRGEA